MNKQELRIVNILFCVLEALVGVLLFIDPTGFTVGILRMLGACLTAAGVYVLIGYFRTEPVAAAATSGLTKGLLLLSGAVVCLFKTSWLIGIFPLITVLYGIIILISGFRKLQWTVDLLRLRAKYWYIALIGAALSILFAVLILCNPFASTTFLWNFIGISLILDAVLDLLALIFGKMQNAE